MIRGTFHDITSITNALRSLALVENMDQNGDGFASQNEVESFGLNWKGSVEQFDLNGKCTCISLSFVMLKIFK